MAQQKDPRVTVDELLLVNTISIDALITVLEAKGVLKREEVLKRVEETRKELDGSARMN
jgi:hypothetical protein